MGQSSQARYAEGSSELREELRIIPIRGRAPEFLTAIATPSNRRLSAAAEALLAAIKRHGNV